MRMALDLARDAMRRNEVPVGALVVQNNEVLSRASNRTVRDQDPTSHAEVLAIREAANKLDRWRLDDCTLYVTGAVRDVRRCNCACASKTRCLRGVG